MPFGKITRKQLNASLPLSQRSNTTSVKAVEKTAAKVYRQLSQKKAHAEKLTGLVLGTTADITELTKITLGDLANQRIGHVINPTSLKFGYSKFNGEATALLSRILIFQWHAASVPVAANILEDTTSPFFAYSSYAQVGKTEFTILYDRTTTQIENNDSEFQVFTNKLISGSKIKKIRYNPGAGTDGTDKLWMYSQSVATGSGHNLNGLFTLRYTNA